MGAVVAARTAYKSGQMHLADPDPSNRLVEGCLYYDRALERVQHQLLEQERKQRAQEAR